MWIGKKETGIENFRTEYLQRVLCDEGGKLLFSRDQIEQLVFWNPIEFYKQSPNWTFKA
jgi:hypothetical protein